MSHFISIDGTDGAGKSTQLERLRGWFAARQLPVYFTREIGGTPLGEQLRQIILHPATSLDALSELLLIFAARRQHVETVIKPKLAAGIHVVSDRFTDATDAYQGGGRGLDAAKIAALERWTLDDFRPDLALILTLPPALAQQRRGERSWLADRIERESDDFFSRVAATYRARAEANPTARLIDASGPPEQVFAQIEEALNGLFGAG